MNVVNGSKYINRLKFFYRKFKRRISKTDIIEIFNSNVKEQSTSINKIFVINLDRQKKRWKKLKNEAHLQKVNNGKTLLDFTERISAVDGRFIRADRFSSQDVEKLYNLKEHFFVDPDPRLSHLVRSKDIKISMSSAEIAVALSHIKIWKKIVSQKIPYSLILEDDIFFDEKFSELSNRAWSELPNKNGNEKQFDLLYFSYREVDNKTEKIPFSENLFLPIRGYWWLSGYALSYKGAKKLIDLLPVCGPVDMWMNLQFQKLDVYLISKSIILQRRDWNSDNSYSIMPILSRVGIHLDKKGSKLEDLITRKPIFAIGLNKTATTSLHFALTLLGYKCCHWISDKFSEETAKLIENLQPLPFDAYTDVNSIIQNYKELDLQYPNAVFILTTRNIDEWIASRSRHVIRNRMENSKGANHNWINIDVDSWKEERKEHHESVFEYFKNRNDKLLILDICGGDGWELLCKFLKLPIPDAAFPNVDPLITNIKS